MSFLPQRSNSKKIEAVSAALVIWANKFYLSVSESRALISRQKLYLKTQTQEFCKTICNRAMFGMVKVVKRVNRYLSVGFCKFSLYFRLLSGVRFGSTDPVKHYIHKKISLSSKNCVTLLRTSLHRGSTASRCAVGMYWGVRSENLAGLRFFYPVRFRPDKQNFIRKLGKLLTKIFRHKPYI